MKQSNEKQKEQLFCVYAARGFSPEEAARRAGYADADLGTQAALLLCNGKIRRRIAKLSRELSFLSPAALARAALERLALGEPEFSAQDGEALPEKQAWFHIAEIKRPKGGGLEVKFCDRLRALSLLAQMGNGGDAANSLIEALSRSAVRMEGEGDGEHI